jgi:hypothetical protein
MLLNFNFNFKFEGNDQFVGGNWCCGLVSYEEILNRETQEGSMPLKTKRKGEEP